MNTFQFDHSLKNIPIPQREQYMKILFAKAALFIERLRWTVFFFLNPDAKVKDIPNTYGFNTSKSAPQSKELANFEKDFYDLITNVEFDNSKSHFQKDLEKQVKRINKSDKVFVFADKTTNIYELETDQYKKLLNDNVTKDYAHTKNQTVKEISKEAKKIAKNLELDDRIEDQSSQQAFITIKDHKNDFPNKIKCRLINPAKTQIGKISKQLLEEINNQIREKTKLQQWRSTDEALNWFKELDRQKTLTFLQLDIVEYYPSITEEILDKAFEFANEVLGYKIDSKTVKIIKHSRNSFLYTKNKTDTNTPWAKKTGLFDVTMGAPDGAEICEFVGLMIINEVQKQFPQLNFGLYRDDGLCVHENIPGPKLDSIRKKLHETFKELGLRITVEINKKQVHFLDVTLDITSRTYKPYRKPNDKPLYINVESNHPNSVLKNIPQSINKRLNNISSSEQHFKETVGPYQAALKASGHKDQLMFDESLKNDNETPQNKRKENNEKKKKKRKIIWFNPPFNKSVKTRIGQRFLNLLDKHFPKNHILRQVVNRNCVKLSYSCTKNVKQIIQAHNNKILQKDIENQNCENKKLCNCRKTNECPLKKNCKGGPLVYKATIQAGDEEYFYLGSSQDFKERYYNHKASFRNEEKQNATSLSKFVWENNMGPEPNIKWDIVKKGQIYQRGQRYCDLCLSEAVQISKVINNIYCLNRKTELNIKCLHQWKHRLCNSV